MLFLLAEGLFELLVTVSGGLLPQALLEGVCQGIAELVHHRSA